MGGGSCLLRGVLCAPFGHLPPGVFHAKLGGGGRPCAWLHLSCPLYCLWHCLWRLHTCSGTMQYSEWRPLAASWVQEMWLGCETGPPASKIRCRRQAQCHLMLRQPCLSSSSRLGRGRDSRGRSDSPPGRKWRSKALGRQRQAGARLGGSRRSSQRRRQQASCGSNRSKAQPPASALRAD